MSFYAPLGGPKLYQMLGLGMYSTRFSSSENNTSVYFSGRTYGAGLELFPRDGAGLFLSVHYSGWAVRRILPGYQKLPLTRLVDNVFDGALGWQGQSGIHHWGIKLSGNYAKRLGTEYIYGDASGSQNYPKLGAVEQYRNNRTDLVLSALWGFDARLVVLCGAEGTLLRLRGHLPEPVAQNAVRKGRLRRRVDRRKTAASLGIAPVGVGRLFGEPDCGA